MNGQDIANRIACGFWVLGILILILAISIKINDLLAVGFLLMLFGFMCCMIGRSHNKWEKQKKSHSSKVSPLVIVQTKQTNDVCLTVKEKTKDQSV